MSETEVTEAPENEATPDEQPAPESPDLSEQFADLSNKVSQFIDSQEQPEPQPAPLDILSGPEDEYEYEDDGEMWEPEQPASDPRVDEIWDWATQQERTRITEGLQALGDKYNDFTERVPEIRSAMDRAGLTDPALRGNPALVERIYLSLKAEADAAAETPAEEAASRGATLERGASAAPPEEQDPDKEFIENFGKGRRESAFG